MSTAAIPDLFRTYTAGGSVRMAQHLWTKPLPTDLRFIGGLTPAEIWAAADANPGSLQAAVRLQHLIRFLGNERPRNSWIDLKGIPLPPRQSSSADLLKRAGPTPKPQKRKREAPRIDRVYA